MNNYLTHVCEACIKEGLPEEESEAFYYCRLCIKHMCAEHLCEHFEGAFNHDTYFRLINDEAARNNREVGGSETSNGFFGEEIVDKGTTEINFYPGGFHSLTEEQLRKRQKQLFQELKAIQKELLARMISSSEFQYKSTSPEGLLRESSSRKRGSRTRAKALKQASAGEALRVYIEAQKAAGISIEALCSEMLRKLKRGSK